MSEIIIIIQEHGRSEALGEAHLSPEAVVGDLHEALEVAGLALDAETFVFIDEVEEPVPHERHHRAHHIRHGSRVHVGRIREIVVSVHFMARTIERKFAPGARIASVKKWAVSELGIAQGDAVEHVLQVHGMNRQPSPDTPIHELVQHQGSHEGHRLELDFVPEKRVEG